MRYLNAQIRTHLASQYVLGVQSLKVRRRYERLLQQHPELLADVYQWQQHMNTINDDTNDVTPPARVWSNLQVLFTPNVEKPPFWETVLAFNKLWFASSACLFLLLLGLAFYPMQTTLQGINYMAVMHQTQNDALEPSLVFTAYKGDAPGKSRLITQWNNRSQSVSMQGLSLWALNRESGEMEKLMMLDDQQKDRFLTKRQWLAIKDSLELIVIKGESDMGEVLYRGQCLQLSG